MGLARAGERLGEEFLAGVRGVASAAAVGVSADVAVGVSYIILVLFCEFFIRDELEALPPEDYAFLEGESDALEEQRILEASVVL